SERWTRRQLYLGGKIVCHQHAPNAWNGFVCQRLNDINEGLSRGDRWKLTEFIEDHKETLKHDYSKLTAAQKNAFVIQVMKKRVENQKIVRNNPKAVQHDMLASFAAMDQEHYVRVEDLSGPKLFFSEKAEKFARAPRSLNKMISACRTHLQDELDYILQENKITDRKITMNYANYERSIVERYGVTLQGWPSALLPVRNPSRIGG
ncbi:hypothetical protein BD769DRAFT_1353658, partial [Suillus cothurnatus]